MYYTYKYNATKYAFLIMQNNKWNWINQDNIIENNDTKKRCLVNSLVNSSVNSLI